MNVFEAEKKVFYTEIFQHHAIIELNSGSAFIAFLRQEKPLR